MSRTSMSLSASCMASSLTIPVLNMTSAARRYLAVLAKEAALPMTAALSAGDVPDQDEKASRAFATARASVPSSGSWMVPKITVLSMGLHRGLSVPEAIFSPPMICGKSCFSRPSTMSMAASKVLSS